MPNLFSEIIIRGHQIKNRIAMPPMVCFSFPTHGGIVTAEHIAHYAARAKGGVGLIIIEATCINITGRLAERQLGLWSDEQIPGFKKIAEVCHKYGAVVLVQIHHAGMIPAPGITDDFISSSSFQGRSRFGGNPITAREMTLNEIKAIQSDFVAAAVRAKKAGLDGIELHGAHGYLISQFLSPIVNKRTDAYGGRLTKRVRFVNEIISEIRKAAGEDFIIDCRMGGFEPDQESGIKIAKLMEKAGVDILHVSSGMDTVLLKDAATEPVVPVGFEYNWIAYSGIEIKKNVRVPVIVCNGIKTPERAEYLVKNGMADLAAIGKSLLVNPEWANEAQQKQDVKVCIECKVCAYFRPGAVCPQARA
jgi:NADPH2 dehydrogenase